MGRIIPSGRPCSFGVPPAFERRRRPPADAACGRGFAFGGRLRLPRLREGANAELYGGWPMVLSGLKTLLETGEKLTTPGSLRYM